MLIRKRCPFTQKINTREIPVTPQQLQAWQAGELVQDAMPNLSPDDREFLITGITPEMWDQTFGGDAA